jgi:hypothetical protein
MQDIESQALLEGVEVAVSMEQAVAMLHAKSCNGTVCRLSHGDALGSQKTVIGRGCDGHFFTARIEDLEAPHLAKNGCKVPLVPEALQELTKNKVGKSYLQTVHLLFQPKCVGIEGCVEVINPNRSVDDGHLGDAGRHLEMIVIIWRS